MIHRVALFLLAVPLAACDNEMSAGAEDAMPSDDVPVAAGSPDVSGAAAAAGGARSVSEENEVWNFDYSYPAAAGQIPGLAALLDQRLDASLQELKETAIEARADADKSGFPFNAYAESTSWKVVTDLPRWLSLSGEIYSYTGGAHGNSGFDTLLWDREEDKARKPEELFTSLAALEAAMREDYCEMLDRQRAEKRGDPVGEVSDGLFDECPGFGDLTIILGSSNNRTFDRIGFLAAPYVAGPYAEGSYEVTLPVNRAANAAVKPEFDAAFTAAK
jgi:hypothetical protein